MLVPTAGLPQARCPQAPGSSPEGPRQNPAGQARAKARYFYALFTGCFSCFPPWPCQGFPSRRPLVAEPKGGTQSPPAADGRAEPPPPPPSPRGAAALPASEASGSAEPRHHVTAGLASEARRKPLTKPVPVPPLPRPRLLASCGPPARAQPRRKCVATGLAARGTGAGSPGGLQPRTARPPWPSWGRLGAAPLLGGQPFVPSPRRGQRLLPES